MATNKANRFANYAKTTSHWFPHNKVKLRWGPEPCTLKRRSRKRRSQGLRIARTDSPLREDRECGAMYIEDELSFGLSTKVFQTCTLSSSSIPTTAFPNLGSKLF